MINSPIQFSGKRPNGRRFAGLVFCLAATPAFAQLNPIPSATVSPAAPTPNDPVTLNIVEVGQYPNPIPTGTITYTLDQNTPGTVTLNAAGQAVIYLGDLGLGSHTVSYTYNGDGSYQAATSSIVFQVIDTKFAFLGSSRTIMGNTGDNEHAAVDSKGNVYFSDFSNGVIRKLDPVTNTVTIFPSTGLRAPQGIAFDSSDNLYIADRDNFRIVEITPAGVQTPLPTFIVSPLNLKFDNAGQNLYITDLETGQILAYNLASQKTTAVTGPIQGLCDIAFDPAGNLYYSERLISGINLARVSGGVTTPIPAPIDVGGLVFDPAGNLYMTDAGNDGLWMMTPQGHFQQLTNVGEGAIARDNRGLLYLPRGTFSYVFSPQTSVNSGQELAFPDGGVDFSQAVPTVYYSSSSGESLSSIAFPSPQSPYRTYQGALTCSGLICYSAFNNFFSHPGPQTDYVVATSSLGNTLTNLVFGNGINSELAFSPGSASAQGIGLQGFAGIARYPDSTFSTGHFLIANTAGNALRQVVGGNVLNTFSVAVQAPTQVFLDTQNNAYALEAGTSRILRGVPNSSGGMDFTALFDTSTQTALNTLSAFALDSATNLWIGGADAGGNGVILFQDTLGNVKVFATGIPVPSAMAVDGFGTVFSADVATGSLYSFGYTGIPSLIATGMASPASLAIEPSGSVYVAGGTGNPVMEIKPDGSQMAVPVSGIGSATAVLVDNQGNLVVADAAAGVIAQVDRSDPQNYAFGNVAVNTVSPVFGSQFLNVGNQSLSFFNGFPGDSTFVPVATANTCTNATVLAPGAVCEQDYTFNPTSIQNYSEQGYVYDNSGGRSTTYSLFGLPFSGAGVIPAPIATVTPASLTFGTIAAGTTAASQLATLKNTGSATLNISSIALSGDAVFAQTNTCGATLAANASCTVTVTYSPAVVGANTGTLTLTDNSLDGVTQTLALTGTGAVPMVTLTPGTHDFGSVYQTYTATQIFTLTNPGPLTNHLSVIRLAPEATNSYSYTTTCGPTLAPATSCAFTIAFKPTAGGVISTSLTVTGSAGTETASLTGTGVALTPTLTPASYDFGSFTASQVFTFANTGSVGFSIDSIQLAAEASNSYSYVTTCGATIAANASCTVTVTFKPGTSGPVATTLSIVDAAGTQTASLTGTGVPLTATLTPASFDFGNASASVSAFNIFTLKNTSSVSYSIGTIQLAAEATHSYSSTNTCGATLAAGASCTVTVTFKPGAQGTIGTILTIKDAAGTQTSTITGAGVSAITVSPSPFSFGYVATSQTPNQGGVSQVFTLTNLSSTALGLKPVGLTTNGSPFQGFSNCPATLNAGATCTATVVFLPYSAGTVTDTLVVQDTLGFSNNVAIDATGTDPSFSLTPANVTLPSIPLGNTAAATFTLTNLTKASQIFNSAFFSGAAPFPGTVATNCPVNVAAGASCTVTATFQPTAAGRFVGTVEVSDAAGIQSSSVQATATTPTATLTPAVYNFPAIPIGATASTTFVLTNTSNGNLSFYSAFTEDFANTGYLSTANNCGSSLPLGGSCNITVTFRPTSVRQAQGTLEVTDGAGLQTAEATGTAAIPTVTLTPASAAFPPTSVTGISTLTFVLTNTSNGPLPFYSALFEDDSSLIGGVVVVTNNCGVSVAKGASCKIVAQFQPTSTKTTYGVLEVTDDGGVQTADITGTPIVPTASLTPAIYTFPSTQAGGKATAFFYLTNTSGGFLLVGSPFMITGSTFPAALTSSCQASLGPGASCLITAVFAPAAAGNFRGGFEIDTSAGAEIASLAGTGTSAVTPASLTITKALTRSAGNVFLTVVITNTGGTTATNVVLTGAQVGALAGTPLPQPMGNLPAGASVTATVAVPGSVGFSGAASSLLVSGTYNGGTFGSSTRITLP